jgi:hypothetical protein
MTPEQNRLNILRRNLAQAKQDRAGIANDSEYKRLNVENWTMHLAALDSQISNLEDALCGQQGRLL